MKTQNRNWSSDNRGQGLTELMLVLPILLLIVIGMAEVGWWVHSYVTVARAAREGARFGSRNIHVEPSTIATVTKDALAESLETIYTGLDTNATVIVTPIDIDADGSVTVLPAWIEGELSVTSAVCNADPCPENMLSVNALGSQNSYFNDDTYSLCSSSECFNDLVVVETFYNHEQLLQLPLISDFLPETFEIKGITVMRITQVRPPTQVPVTE